jgi:peptidyl-prolyl cis-trans isomerase B (cyclophilin B)
MSRSLGVGLLLAVLWAAPSLLAQRGPAAGRATAKAPAATPVPPSEAVIDTGLGQIVVRLLPELAPGHVRYFMKLAKSGAYAGTTFHRIIRGGIIQGGDPLSKDPKRASQYGTGGLGVLKAEFSSREFKRGTVAAVRRPRDVDSAGSQFFICLSDQPALRGQYTIFGEVVSGMDVADKIGETPTDGDRAKQRIEIRAVSLRPAPAQP